MIQAPGLLGTPFAGQSASALANASCMASSAQSNDRQADQSRKDASGLLLENALGDRTPINHLEKLLKSHRADFYGTDATGEGRRDFLGPVDRFVEIPAFEDVVTGELLLGFCERPIDD